MNSISSNFQIVYNLLNSINQQEPIKHSSHLTELIKKAYVTDNEYNHYPYILTEDGHKYLSFLSKRFFISSSKNNKIINMINQ